MSTLHTAGSNANYINRGEGTSIAHLVEQRNAGLVTDKELEDRAAPYRKREAERLEEKGVLVPRPSTTPEIKFKNFVLMPKEPSVTDISAIMNLEITYMPPLFSHMCKPLIDKNTAQPFVNKLLFTSFGPRFQAETYIQKLRDIPEYKEPLDKAVNMMYGGGSMVGLFARLVSGSRNLNRMEVNKRWARDFTLTKDKVLKYMPLKPKTMVLSHWNQVHYVPNWDADYGMPRPGEKKRDHKDEIINQMIEIFEVFRKREHMQYFFKAHPELYVVMIKNKTSLYEIAQWQTKIRPYYVYPAALCLLYSHLMEYMTDQLYSVTEHPTSCYLPGFSWAHGGAHHLAQIILTIQPGTFRIFLYSDDLTVVYFDPLAKCVKVVQIDAKALDMAFLHQDAAGLCNQVKQCYMDHLSDTFKLIQAFHISHALDKPVLLPKGLMYQFKWNFGSGTPGTTFYGTHFMLQPSVEYAELVTRSGWMSDDAPKAENVFNKYGIALKMCEVVDGLDLFNVGPDIGHPFAPIGEEFESEFVILGQKLAFESTDNEGGGVWYPKPSLNSLVASYLRPPRATTKPPHIFYMARIFGLAVSGGWCYPDFFNVLAEDYAKLSSEVADISSKMLLDYISLEGNGLESAMRELLPLCHKTLPKREIFRYIYTDEKPIPKPEKPIEASEFDPSSLEELLSSVTLNEVKSQAIDAKTDMMTDFKEALPLSMPSAHLPKFPKGMPVGNTPPQPDKLQKRLDRKRRRKEKRLADQQARRDEQRSNDKDKKHRGGKRDGDVEEDDDIHKEEDAAEEAVVALEEEKKYEALTEQHLREERRKNNEANPEELFEIDEDQSEDDLDDDVPDELHAVTALNSDFSLPKSRVFVKVKHSKKPP